MEKIMEQTKCFSDDGSLITFKDDPISCFERLIAKIEVEENHLFIDRHQGGSLDFFDSSPGVPDRHYYWAESS